MKARPVQLRPSTRYWRDHSAGSSQSRVSGGDCVSYLILKISFASSQLLRTSKTGLRYHLTPTLDFRVDESTQFVDRRILRRYKAGLDYLIPDLLLIEDSLQLRVQFSNDITWRPRGRHQHLPRGRFVPRHARFRDGRAIWDRGESGLGRDPERAHGAAL